MISRPALVLFALAALASPAAAPAQASKFKLKAGAAGAVCLDCHGDFQDVLKKPFVHTPVKAKRCTDCHSPHASGFKKLLSAEGNRSCAGCHSVVPDKALSTHKPVAEGTCMGCHEPHASAAKFNLKKPGNEMCSSCHKQVLEAAAKAKARHRPVEQGCTTCHDPHGSAKGPSLLKQPLPALCTGCHKTDKPIFAKQHVGYGVAKSDCTSCHAPHGSKNRGMLADTVHAPVAKGMCNQCHEPAGTPGQLKTKAVGVQLCRGCHNQKVNAILDKGRVHVPVLEGIACLNCHAPHASSGKGLLRGGTLSVCGKCHGDTLRRQERSPSKHQPIEIGDCTSCHDPHSGNASLLFVGANVVDMCGSCHDWLKHSSHPMGEKAKDQRNRNLRLDCLSCHRAHGTEFKKMLLNATQSEMCVKCHKQYQR
ncbi:MAG TPA: cytochrome c3 family protein [Anaeromyxobacteraceae bacterium]|nr:cytochrome c3 family protein [Anaeromyxobacteraceae bacterium]